MGRGFTSEENYTKRPPFCVKKIRTTMCNAHTDFTKLCQEGDLNGITVNISRLTCNINDDQSLKSTYSKLLEAAATASNVTSLAHVISLLCNVDVNSWKDVVTNALFVACLQGNLDCVKLLVNQGKENSIPFHF